MTTNMPRPPFGDRGPVISRTFVRDSAIQRFFNDRCIDIDPSLPAAEAVAEWLDITGEGQSASFTVEGETFRYESGSGRTRLEITTSEELSVELQKLTEGRLTLGQRVGVLYAIYPWDEESRNEQFPDTQFGRLHHEVEIFCLGGDDVVLFSEQEARLLGNEESAPVAVFAVPETSAPKKALRRKIRALLPEHPRRELWVDHLSRLTHDMWAGCQSATVYFRKGEDGRTYGELDVSEYPTLSEEVLSLIGAKREGRFLRRYKPE